MSDGKLDFNLTSTGIGLTGTASSPEELATFIDQLRCVLPAFERITRDSDGSGGADETALAGSTVGDSAGRSDSGGIAHD